MSNLVDDLFQNDISRRSFEEFQADGLDFCVSLAIVYEDSRYGRIQVVSGLPRITLAGLLSMGLHSANELGEDEEEDEDDDEEST